MKKIVIFDYDGVIVDSLDAYEKSVLSVFQKHGVDQIHSRETFLDLFEGNFFTSALKLGMPSEKMPEILNELEPMLRSLRSEIKVFGGMKDVLNELLQKYKVFIVTSNLASIVIEYLKSQNILGIEEIIGAEKEISKVKKIEDIKARFPDHCVIYIGDTKGDMIEGKRAGAETIAISWGWHDAGRLREGEPDYFAENPRELLSIIENLS